MLFGRGTSITERTRLKLQNLQFFFLTGPIIFLKGNTELKSLCITRRLMLIDICFMNIS